MPKLSPIDEKRARRTRTPSPRTRKGKRKSENANNGYNANAVSRITYGLKRNSNKAYQRSIARLGLPRTTMKNNLNLLNKELNKNKLLIKHYLYRPAQPRPSRKKVPLGSKI